MQQIKFSLVSNCTDETLLPRRSTKNSAGYDFFARKEITVPKYEKLMYDFKSHAESSYSLKLHTEYLYSLKLDEVASLTKELNIKPTLIPTGVKAYMPSTCYLQLTARSSMPLKHWLILANGVGVIDADYVDNPDNEGEIFFQFINLSPVDITIQKGEKIGQGIFLPYFTAVNDNASGERIGGFGSTGQ